MAGGLKALVALAFFGSVGMTLLVIGCAIYENWWPLFVIMFYLLSPLPILISKRYNGNGGFMGGPSNACQELAIFLTMGIVISAFGLPIIMSRTPQTAQADSNITSTITPQAAWYTIGGNVVVFMTIAGFFFVFGGEDVDYSMW